MARVLCNHLALSLLHDFTMAEQKEQPKQLSYKRYLETDNPWHRYNKAIKALQGNSLQGDSCVVQTIIYRAIMFTVSGLQLTLPQTITGAFQDDQTLPGTASIAQHACFT